MLRHRKLLSLPKDDENRALTGLGCNGDYLAAINSHGLPHCYSCHVPPTLEKKIVRVEYDYEFIWNNTGLSGTDFASEILPRLEWGVLSMVSSDFYVRTCQTERQEFQNFTIVGLSSLYLDFRDMDIDSCEYLVTEFACEPMSGSMIAEYIGEASAVDVETALLSAISKVMQSGESISHSILEVLYIGDRTSFEGLGVSSINSVQGQSSTGGDNQIKGASIAASLAALLLLFALLGAALLVRRKSDQSEQRNKMDVVLPPHFEIAPEESPKLDNQSFRSVVSDAELPSSPPRNQNSSSDIEEAADDTASVVVLVDLPPELAPGPPQATTENEAIPAIKSETLKKRRKKKKKKFKKVTLVRVNSRENIASMETISETDEAEQQDELEDDLKTPNGPIRTYSTSEDESSAYSTASSDNEQDLLDREFERRPLSVSPSRRRDLPPLPPVEF